MKNFFLILPVYNIKYCRSQIMVHFTKNNLFQIKLSLFSMYTMYGNG